MWVSSLWVSLWRITIPSDLASYTTGWIRFVFSPKFLAPQPPPQRCSHRQRTEPIPQIAGGFWVFFLCLSLPELCSLQLVQWEHRALVPHAVSTVFGHLPPSASANLYFGTVNWFLCFLWADKNLSFSKVLVFKLCKSFFFLFPLNPMSQLKSKLKGSWAVDALRGRHANRFDGC